MPKREMQPVVLLATLAFALACRGGDSATDRRDLGDYPDRYARPADARDSAAGALAEKSGNAPDHAARVETVASGLVVPWGLAFTPDGRLFVTERPGRIRVIENGRLVAEPWATIEVAAESEAGLLGIAIAPDFPSSRAVYVVATVRERQRLINRVLRIVEQNGRGTTPTVIVDGSEGNRVHAGNAIAFGPDGMLYVATGDAQEPTRAQDRASLNGKLLRYRPDGTPAPGNPFGNSPVYALGLRNVQGLAWDPASGQLFATEHGPSGFPNEGGRTGHDELNAIRAGGNYGWPRMAGTSGGDRSETAGDIAPLTDWTPAIAPSGLAVYTGSEFPAWRGNLFVGALRGQQLRRVVVARAPNATSGWRVAEQESVISNLGRIRAVAMGPDGHLYFTTSNRDGRGSPARDDDRVLRLTP
jgi:glucose/arabinose dehydrogenase